MLQGLLVKKEEDSSGQALFKIFYEFLKTYKVDSRSEDYFFLRGEESNKKQNIENDDSTLFYLKQSELMRAADKKNMMVNLQHIITMDSNYEVRDSIINDFTRFEPYMNQAVNKLMQELYAEWALKRTFYVSIYNYSHTERIRDLRANKIGKLISVSATITRTSEVRPELLEGAFSCGLCNSIAKGIQQQFRYTEPKICINPNCSNRQKWELSNEDSVFADWQKLRIQENPSDIPAGSMPRSLDVIIRNDIVESCKPGDKCKFIGTLLVVPDILSLSKPGEKVQYQLKREAVRKEEQKPMDGVSGLKQLGVRDMSYKMIFIAQSIEFSGVRFNPLVMKSDNEKDENITHNFNPSELDRILDMRQIKGIYKKLSHCIAPSVFGHEQVKGGILLMLLGGVNKNTSEGIKLRGDLNLCIVGDPSTAKSQFLKYVSSTVPRAIYTSGKGSTAAGLTASVVRDPETGEFCIEAGALMLADNGICCIDEFDKMDQKDQVAIHEAMEQQTISIAKAGIQATLMARTSILAASNPVRGRYDKTKPLKYNIDISAPIMSRFDLFFIIVDECDEFVDYKIAKHIVDLHRLPDEMDSLSIDQKSFLLYLKFAKNLRPKLTKEAAEVLREEYLKLRESDISVQKAAYRITVRQLESLVRLSEAMARVYLDDKILPTYVREAAKLLKTSIINVEMQDVELDGIEEDLEKDRKHEEEKMKQKNLQNNNNNNVDNIDNNYNNVNNSNSKDIDNIDNQMIHMDIDSKSNNDNNNNIDNNNDNDKKKIKIKMSGQEYEKIKNSIIRFIRELENEDTHPKHSDVVEYLIEQQMDMIEDKEQASKITSNINAIIDKLISEGVLVVLSDNNEDIYERELSLNVRYHQQMDY